MFNVFVPALSLLCLPLFGEEFRNDATFLLLLLFFSLLSPIFTDIWFEAEADAWTLERSIFSRSP